MSGTTQTKPSLAGARMYTGYQEMLLTRKSRIAGQAWDFGMGVGKMKNKLAEYIFCQQVNFNIEIQH